MAAEVNSRRRVPLWPLLIGLTLLVALASFVLRAPVPLQDLWSSSAEAARVARVIFIENRLYRILAGLLVGASLAAGGAALQSTFRNPLAEPYLLGISAGGALGATLAEALHLPTAGWFDATSALAFIGALGASAGIYALGTRRSSVAWSPHGDNARLLLTGVALSAFLTALMSLVIALSGSIDLAQKAAFWLMGGLTRSSGPQDVFLACSLFIGLGLLFSCSRDLNALRAGDEDAAALGVSLPALHRRVLIAVSLLSATSVAAAGLIGFVGLLAPHVVRLLGGRDMRVLLPGSALFGAALLCGCDALARSARPPVEIPVGIITALLGVPLFLSLARKS